MMRTNIVGRRALRVAMAMSLAAFLVSGSLTYILESRSRISAVEEDVGALYAAQLPGIAEGLWNYDEKLLRAFSEAARLYPYVNYIRIADEGSILVEGGERKAGSLAKSFSLDRAVKGKSLRIGTLELEIDSSRIRADVGESVIASFVPEICFLAVVSLIFFLSFSRLITRHLATIAASIESFDSSAGAPLLALDKADRGDELDLLVRSLNASSDNLRLARASELQALEGMRLSEERNRILVDEAPDAILMYDASIARFVSCNRQAELLFGRNRDEIMRSDLGELYCPEQPGGLTVEQCVAESTAEAFSGSKVVGRRRIARPNGEILVCELRMVAVPPLGPDMLRASYLDITERVLAEGDLVRSLREKETLLQEINHRTKNNMQLIISMLSMRAAECGDERVDSIVEDMNGRIASIALVHEKLYESRDLSRIDLAGYVEDLVMEIRNAYLSYCPGVSMLIEAEKGIVATIDTAVPCGLALNELIVNSILHAFPSKLEGKVNVRLSRDEAGGIILSVADDGVGFPPGFDFRKDGKTGIRTILALIESQLRGAIEYSLGGTGSGAGTTCVIRLSGELYRPRV